MMLCGRTMESFYVAASSIHRKTFCFLSSLGSILGAARTWPLSDPPAPAGPHRDRAGSRGDALWTQGSGIYSAALTSSRVNRWRTDEPANKIIESQPSVARLFRTARGMLSSVCLSADTPTSLSAALLASCGPPPKARSLAIWEGRG